LVVPDITRGIGSFNLALGIVGSAVSIGTALSTSLAGYVMDHFGRMAAFGLAIACGLWLGIAVAAVCQRGTYPITGHKRGRAGRALTVGHAEPPHRRRLRSPAADRLRQSFSELRR
jgi:MFS family permease